MCCQHSTSIRFSLYISNDSSKLQRALAGSLYKSVLRNLPHWHFYLEAYKSKGKENHKKDYNTLPSHVYYNMISSTAIQKEDKNLFIVFIIFLRFNHNMTYMKGF